MSWPILVGLVVVLGVSLLVVAARRAELKRMHKTVHARDTAVRLGADKAQLQHPVIDLSRCLGCGTCVAACPEDNVLELVHGQAMVVNGAHCVGHAACERECPVSAITVTLSDLDEREDIPVITGELEAVGSPGLFLAGEVTAHALIKTAIAHGTAVGQEVARRVAADPGCDSDVLDLCVVGAGPAGLACSLEAKQNGLTFVTLEQEPNVGGTVAKYPRRKLVVSQPVEMPLHGVLRQKSYLKEELMDLWAGMAAEHELPIQGGQVFEGLERDPQGHYVVYTATHTFLARHVCLALGRRGVPNKIGVPGEDSSKVAYSLLDANSYQGRRALVVGGGNSAVEAALGLAEQPGNDVTLSYRKEAFFRIRPEIQQRLDESVAENRIRLLLESNVRSIGDDSVEIEVMTDTGPRRARLLNDDVFVMAGGTAPIKMLEASGVSFDASLREARGPLMEQGTGLTRALSAGFALALFATAWAVWNADYYMLPVEVRPTHGKHAFLRPGLGVGLWLGIAATAMVLVNLLYLLRRSARLWPNFGSLKTWMTSHVATGILALLCAMLHGAMAPGDSPGGHAFWALVVLMVTGAIGRYFYACVPRAANGRELELAEVKTKLGLMSEEWDKGQRKFREHVRAEVTALIEARQWKSTLVGRIFELVGVQRGATKLLRHLAEQGREQGVAENQIKETITLARRAHRVALMAAHYEDLRGLLGGWRYLHRWVAALLVLLVVVHIVHAIVYGAVFFDGGGR